MNANVKLIQKKGTGYSNLRQHVQNQHKDYENQINQYEHNSKSSFIPSNSAKKVYNWLRMVILCNLPFSIVDNEIFRECSNQDPIARNTLMKYIKQLDLEVTNNIKSILPDHFGLIFDGWSSGTMDGLQKVKS